MNPALEIVLAQISRMESDLGQLRLDVTRLGGEVPVKVVLNPVSKSPIPAGNIMLKAAFASAECFHCTVHDLISPKRLSGQVAVARYVAWLILHKNTKIDKKHVASYFGKRTTDMVRYGIRQMMSWLNLYHPLRVDFERAEKMFLDATIEKESRVA